MIDQQTTTGIGLLILIVLGSLGNFLWARLTKKRGIKESRDYVDQLVKIQNEKIAELEAEIANLKQENIAKAEEVKTAQTERDTARDERDAARKENHTLLERLEEERQNVVKMSNSLEEQEKRIQVLEQAAGKNEAVKEALQELVGAFKEAARQLVIELSPKPVAVASGAADVKPGVQQ